MVILDGPQFLTGENKERVHSKSHKTNGFLGPLAFQDVHEVAEHFFKKTL